MSSLVGNKVTVMPTCCLSLCVLLSLGSHPTVFAFTIGVFSPNDSRSQQPTNYPLQIALKHETSGEKLMDTTRFPLK